MLDASRHGLITVHPARRALVAGTSLLLALCALVVALVVAAEALVG